MAAQLAFMLSLALLAVTGLAFGASELYGHGFHWADQVCNGAPALCESRHRRRRDRRGGRRVFHFARIGSVSIERRLAHPPRISRMPAAMLGSFRGLFRTSRFTAGGTPAHRPPRPIVRAIPSSVSLALARRMIRNSTSAVSASPEPSKIQRAAPAPPLPASRPSVPRYT